MPLYPYQERVKALIQSGKAVVLQAPTGAGKTRAALAPFIESFFDSPAGSFPRRCVYVVPMRVLAHQFEREYREHAGSYKRGHGREMRVTIQTGDQPDDPRFERGDLIFCTIDQFLSSYFTMPYSLPRRMANLNAGAMVGAYIVLDEFHLLDPQSSLPSTLYALRQLRQLAPVLLMTATFSTAMLEALAKGLDAEVELVRPDEAREIENRTNPQTPRQRTWRTADAPLSAAAVLAEHHSRSLVLCNTVRNAQSLYRELRRLSSEQRLDIRLMLLHSRFLPDDRRKIEDELHRLFGKGEDADGAGSVIAVATQAIEVGVDITCETLHTELAPASALIQRAGRCARFPGEQGRVIVYPVESYMPYGRERPEAQDEVLWVREMKTAFGWLAANSGQTFDFDKEQAFVNAVATPRDRQVLTEVSAGGPSRRQAIQRVLRGDRAANDSRLLVRDADSRMVLIHSQPDRLLQNPYGAIGFSLQPGALFGMFAEWQKRGADLEWRVMRLVESKPDQQEDERAKYGWEPVEQADGLAAAQVLVVNPALAGYLPDEGFLADFGGTPFQSSLPPEAAARTRDGLSYRLESYEDHVRQVLGAFQRMVWPELSYPAQALERTARWPEGCVSRAAQMVCLLHDVGKLSKGWQGWARAYQKEIGHPVQLDFAAAHTDMEWGNPRHEEAERAIRGNHPKPHHAGEGALATCAILNVALERNKPLVRAALAAIVRHHTPFAQECEPYTLEPQAAAHVQATVTLLPEETRQRVSLTFLKAGTKTPCDVPLAEPHDTYGWLAYLLLARALRRADQEGTAQGSKEA
jgi:CRISPR-associated endonuclease/helicase Cas3